jgi:hypothetical protein
VPFLYSTNGESIRFLDVRHELNVSRELAGFHTPDALLESLGRDFDAAGAKLMQMPNDSPRIVYVSQSVALLRLAAGVNGQFHTLATPCTGYGRSSHITANKCVWRWPSSIKSRQRQRRPDSVPSNQGLKKTLHSDAVNKHLAVNLPDSCVSRADPNQ